MSWLAGHVENKAWSNAISCPMELKLERWGYSFTKLKLLFHQCGLIHVIVRALAWFFCCPECGKVR